MNDLPGGISLMDLASELEATIEATESLVFGTNMGTGVKGVGSTPAAGDKLSAVRDRISNAMFRLRDVNSRLQTIG